MGKRPHLKHGHYGPKEGVEVFPVRQRVSIPLRAKLAAEQMHPQDAEEENGTNTNRKTEDKYLHQTPVVDLGQINRGISLAENALWLVLSA